MRLILYALPLGLYFGGLLSVPYFGPVLAAWAGDMNSFYQLAIVFSLAHGAGLVAGGYYYFRWHGKQASLLAAAGAVLITAGATLTIWFLSPGEDLGLKEILVLVLYGVASGWPVALYGRWFSSPATAGARGLIMGGNVLLANIILFLVGQGLETGLFTPGYAAAVCTTLFLLGGALILFLPAGPAFSPPVYPTEIKSSLPPGRMLAIGCLVYFTGGLYYQTILPELSSISPSYLIIAPYFAGLLFLGPWSDRRGRGSLMLCSLLLIGGGFSLWAASVQLPLLGGIGHMMIISGLLSMDLFYWTSLADSAPPGAGSLTMGLGLGVSVIAIILPVLIGSFVPRDVILLRTISGALGVSFALLSLVMIREKNLDFSIRAATEAGVVAKAIAPSDLCVNTGDQESPSGGGPDTAAVTAAELQRLRDYNLTSREQEIAFLLVREYSSREITDHLCISQNTLKYHIKNILRKTDTNNRQELRERILVL